jgi:hypothetical protein
MRFIYILFDFFYNIALKNSHDHTPEHTALISVTLLEVFNIAAILIVFDSKYSIIHEGYKVIFYPLGILLCIMNYLVFLKDKKYLKFHQESQWKHIVFVLVYIALSIYFLYSSFFILADSVKK